MTPSVRTLQGSKIKSFKGSSSLCPRGSNSRGFSINYLNTVKGRNFKTNPFFFIQHKLNNVLANIFYPSKRRYAII